MIAERVELEPRTVIGLHDTVAMTALADFFGRACTMVGEELAQHGVAPTGPPLALYHGMRTETIDIIAGCPIAEPITTTNGSVVTTLPGGPAITTVHTGTYDTMTETYAELMKWLEEQDLKTSDDMWEEYLVGPELEDDPTRWQTRIVFPLAAGAEPRT